MEDAVMNRDTSVDSLDERLAGVVRLFLCCHSLDESVLRIKVLEDMFSGETSELLHDIAGMLEGFCKEIDKE